MTSFDDENEIGVFPNSGHHYTFVPIPDELVGETSELRALCVKDDVPWSTHPEHHWIRYRPGTKDYEGQSQCGLWVAIESNLGDVTRGFVFEPRRNVEPRPVDPGYDALKTPYAFHDVNGTGGVDPMAISIPLAIPPDGRTVAIPIKPIVW